MRVCDWWSNVNCPASEQLYSNNDELYRSLDLNDAEEKISMQRNAKNLWYTVGNGDDENDHNYYDTNVRVPLSSSSLSSARLSSASSRSKTASNKAFYQNTKNSFRGTTKYSHTLQKYTDKKSDNLIENQASHSTQPQYSFGMNRKKFTNELHPSSQRKSDSIGPSITKGSKGKHSKSDDYGSFHTINDIKAIDNSNTKGNRNTTVTNDSLQSTKRPLLDGNHRQRQSNPKTIARKDHLHGNNLQNESDLKDYKSKIKNKYNIDYDHALEAEYEIIEAVEWESHQ